MRALQTATLLVATLGAGLMAGLFAAFAYAVMPGLARSADRTFVQAMRHINRAILNGWFLVPFLLPIPLLVLATVLAWNGHGRVALPWIVAALVLYLAGFLVTSGVNVPLNNALDRADTGDDSRAEAARAAFEGRWVTFNTVRALLHTAAFGLLAWALFLHGTVGVV
ncbi:anthrone oxygenase family protein [Streptomyces platensis]|uniref:anthrone oxygenase family protein n=1 Tax=Streptomyces platensis TaxID=58346 RepID=UPI00368CE65F